MPSPELLNTLSILFATEVPALALLVVPSAFNVRKTVEEFQSVGVDAQAIDLSTPIPPANSDAPKLLISTISTTRGLDIPSLTHVFILGSQFCKETSDYRHVAGRVGRFGKKGTVINIIEDTPELEEEKSVGRLFRRLNIDPRQISLDYLISQ